ncbi:DNA-binding transcriptional regulator, AcrR family [Micromonospora viridifaciens]|uniref:DNA-binding transcriptional regulator, AcrR family n=1 Tax=Micromonospora viridifaciens TaxID=1881 RepID=A0A1C4ZVE7_MICVI|nr:TetR/AcrR family transcriptional regulator [Micromonospora viridifaciens]SCF36923.1 DNA-binding transcriptional regulator, AcrR family [Micromonospora viridifaciens]
MARSRAYHHGDLRRALLDAAVEAMTESGPAALSLRDLARRAGVSHAAPAHHFGDKAGLLTALAAQGFDRLTEALRGAGDDLVEVGVAYVGFAVRHRAHFEVMFRPDLYHADDAEVTAARARAGEVLRTGVARHTGRGPEVDSLAAWSIVHGFATLWLAGALPPRVGPDPEAAARTVISRLFA